MARQYQLSEAARFAGGLEEALERYDRLTADGDLATEVADLRDRVALVEARLRALDVKGAIGRAGQRFTLLVSRILPDLDAERKNDPVQLVIDDLTLKVTGDGREDYLWEIGSGANWLAYHIATIIALHQVFGGLSNNHVPTFAIFDQPSQVYFPRLEAGSPDAAASGPLRLRDEDVLQVRKIFQVLAEMTRTSKGRWQALVLDHAAQDVWGDIDRVHLVEDWHEGDKLIPATWLD